MALSVPLSNPKQNSSAQQEILASGILISGFNCILQMPTGSGKTWLAEQAIAHVLQQGKRAIYLTPLRALAEELTTRWQQKFSDEKVGVFSGDYARSSYPVSFRDARLLVMTPEKLDACIRNWRSHWHWIPEVDLLVVDELHLLGDTRRGSRLEGTIMRLMRLNPFARILGLSATLGNRHELADWLGGVEYSSTVRPIPLRWKISRYKKATEKPELLLREIQPIVDDGGQSLVFVQSRRRAETIAEYIRDKGLQVHHHHSGLNRQSRKLVEQQFRDRDLKVLVSTPTLEMGVNLPVRQVILYDLQTFNGQDFVPLPVNNVWQRAGRAGRLGLDTQGDVVLFAPSWDSKATEYAESEFDPIRSGLVNDHMLAEQILTEVSSGLAKNSVQLENVFAGSLAAKQRRTLPIQEAIAQMRQSGMLVEKEYGESLKLQTTRLGWIAVRHLLSPQTVLLFRRVLEECEQLTFLDLLIVLASSEDCEPLLPVDYEQLEELEQLLQQEPSFLLEISRSELSKLLGIDGKRLLCAFHTALTMRLWTLIGDTESVAQKYGCYQFEVHRLRESMLRLLQGMSGIANTLETEQKGFKNPEIIPLKEKIQVLTRMVDGGIDEGSATLTVISGIGAKLAKRLKDYDIEDLEDLALSSIEELAQIPGISTNRAETWIEQSSEIVDCNYSASRYQEEVTNNQVSTIACPIGVEPYRLRRAVELKVLVKQRNTYRVTGGLDPHTVNFNKEQIYCDCADFAKGHTCKHILAVRLYRGDKQLQQIVYDLKGQERDSGLNLLELWMLNK